MQAETLALTGARLWDGLGDRLSHAPVTVRIEAGRIAALQPGPGEAATRGARVLELDGAVLMPGLIDAHVHLGLDPALRSPREQLALPRERRRAAMAARASAMLRAGITTARDLGWGDGLDLALRDDIAAGRTPGPRLLCAAQPVTSPGGHCHFWGGEARGPAGVEAVVRRQLARGADWIKVMATGGVFTRRSRPGAPQLRSDELRAAVEAAAAGGRWVAAHCHGTEGVRRAAAAGVRTVEHCSFAGDGGFGADLDAAVVELLGERARAGALWVSPTVNAGWGRHLPPGAPGATEASRGPTAFGLRMVRVLRTLRGAGVPLVASTDAGIPGVEAWRLPEALAVLADLAGMRPVEALRAATSEAARALEIGDETGALAVGRAADLLAVDGDPLADLGCLRRPRLVVARGRVVPPAGDQPLAS